MQWYRMGLGGLGLLSLLLLLLPPLATEHQLARPPFLLLRGATPFMRCVTHEKKFFVTVLRVHVACRRAVRPLLLLSLTQAVLTDCSRSLPASVHGERRGVGGEGGGVIPQSRGKLAQTGRCTLVALSWQSEIRRI